MPVFDPTDGTPTQQSGALTLVWDAEAVVTSPPGDEASQAVGLHRDPHLPNCLSVEVEFSADPGAFQIDVQVADTNQDKYFVTKASLTSGLNTDFIGRVELTNVVAKFVRLKLVTLTNAVDVTAKIF